MDEERIIVVYLTPSKEQFVFIAAVDKADEIVHEVGKQAQNPDLAFNWNDAAVVAHKIRVLAAG
jgi:hypothetical protein